MRRKRGRRVETERGISKIERKVWLWGSNERRTASSTFLPAVFVGFANSFARSCQEWHHGPGRATPKKRWNAHELAQVFLFWMVLRSGRMNETRKKSYLRFFLPRTILLSINARESADDNVVYRSPRPFRASTRKKLDDFRTASKFSILTLVWHTQIDLWLCRGGEYLRQRSVLYLHVHLSLIVSYNWVAYRNKFSYWIFLCWLFKLLKCIKKRI